MNLPIATTKKELVTILIREDLKSQKVFDSLRALGLEDPFYQCDLTEIILSEVGLNAESEKDQYFYNRLVKDFSQRVTNNPQQLNDLADELLSKLREGRR
jgi:hypothetical protein